jgi:hypothetical protein
MKEKTYPFTTKGLLKAKLDVKQDKINKVIDYGFWIIIAVLVINGTITTNGIINMAACTTTSKVVRWFMR